MVAVVWRRWSGARAPLGWGAQGSPLESRWEKPLGEVVGKSCARASLGGLPGVARKTRRKEPDRNSKRYAERAE